MGTAANTSKLNPSGSLKSKVSYLFLLIPLAGIFALLWKATHTITKPDESIFEAAEKGNYQDVRAHILTGTPVNNLSGEGHTPLYYAVLSGQEDVVELLLKNGASPNAEAKGQTSPLYAAAGEGNLKLVQDLIAAGADPKEQHRSGATALYAAADSGNPRIVKIFLDAGADPNGHLNNTSGTPLGNACIKGNLDSVLLLLDHGANVNVTGFQGRTPLHLAVQNGRYDVVKLLIERGANVDKSDSNFVLPLSTALEKHIDEKIAWLLYDHMNNFRALDFHSSNVLHYAADGGSSVKMMKALLSKGADPNQIDYMGETPLNIALTKGHQDLVQALEEGGARVTLRELINQRLMPPPLSIKSNSQATK